MEILLKKRKQKGTTVNISEDDPQKILEIRNDPSKQRSNYV